MFLKANINMNSDCLNWTPTYIRNYLVFGLETKNQPIPESELCLSDYIQNIIYYIFLWFEEFCWHSISSIACEIKTGWLKYNKFREPLFLCVVEGADVLFPSRLAI